MLIMATSVQCNTCSCHVSIILKGFTGLGGVIIDKYKDIRHQTPSPPPLNPQNKIVKAN